jgi:hypothetical protein
MFRPGRGVVGFGVVTCAGPPAVPAGPWAPGCGREAFRSVMQGPFCSVRTFGGAEDVPICFNGRRSFKAVPVRSPVTRRRASGRRVPEPGGFGCRGFRDRVVPCVIGHEVFQNTEGRRETGGLRLSWPFGPEAFRPRRGRFGPMAFLPKRLRAKGLSGQELSRVQLQ